MQIAADGDSHFWTSVLNGTVQAEDRMPITYHGSFRENKSQRRVCI